MIIRIPVCLVPSIEVTPSDPPRIYQYLEQPENAGAYWTTQVWPTPGRPTPTRLRVSRWRAIVLN
jgi:hypothetical protein